MIVSASGFPPGQFYHVAGTYDGTTMNLYVDGVLEASRSVGLTVPYTSSLTWNIGVTALKFRPPNNTFARTWVGLIDEVEIFNRALSQSEIQDIFNAGSAGKCKIEPVADVTIDIKPGSFPNSINLGSGGTTPVAILGSATLDVNDIVITTLTLGTAGIKTVGKTDKILCSIEDVSGDFSVSLEGAPDTFDDLVCHFVTVDVIPEAGDTDAKISGDLISGGTFEGTDSVNIVP